MFTATLTPNANIEDATNLITVGTAWSDRRDNAPAAASTSSSYTVDTVPPAASITVEDITADNTINDLSPTVQSWSPARRAATCITATSSR